MLLPVALARSPRRRRQGLRDSNWQVRLAAAEAMAQLGEVKEGLKRRRWEGISVGMCFFKHI